MGGSNDDSNQPNGVSMLILTIIRNIVSLAAEAECGALLYYAKELEALMTTLIEVGHTQQATEIITENSTADGIMRGTIKQKRTEHMDTSFYWVRGQVEQKNFEIK